MVTAFRDRLAELLAEAQAKLARDFRWETLSEAFLTFIDEAMLAAKDELLNPGPEKKAAVLEWVAAFYDQVIAKLPLPAWLLWIKLPYVAGLLRGLSLTIASGLIEALYARDTEKFSA